MDNNTKYPASDAGQPLTLTRRQALRAAAGTGLLLLLPMLPAPAEGEAEKWTTVGKADRFPLNQPQRVSPKGSPTLFVTRTGDVALTAVSAKCTHRGCEVFWNKVAGQLSCPCHGAAFAADGKNLHGTRSQPSRTLPALVGFPVRQKDGQVQVNLAPPAPVPPPAPAKPPR